MNFTSFTRPWSEMPRRVAAGSEEVASVFSSGCPTALLLFGGAAAGSWQGVGIEVAPAASDAEAKASSSIVSGLILLVGRDIWLETLRYCVGYCGWVVASRKWFDWCALHRLAFILLSDTEIDQVSRFLWSAGRHLFYEYVGPQTGKLRTAIERATI